LRVRASFRPENREVSVHISTHAIWTSISSGWNRSLFIIGMPDWVGRVYPAAMCCKITEPITNRIEAGLFTRKTFCPSGMNDAP
jgi:hypothetical protein